MIQVCAHECQQHLRTAVEHHSVKERLIRLGCACNAGIEQAKPHERMRTGTDPLVGVGQHEPDRIVMKFVQEVAQEVDASGVDV